MAGPCPEKAGKDTLRPRSTALRKQTQAQGTALARQLRKEYFQQHGDRLQREALEVRQQAARVSKQTTTALNPWPVTAAAWQDVLSGSDCLNPERVKTIAEARCRRSARLQPREDLLPEVTRILPTPRCKPPYPTWLRKVAMAKSPVVAIHRGAGQCPAPTVLMVAQTRLLQPWGLILELAPSGSQAHVLIRPNIPLAAIKPVHELVDIPPEEDTQVYIVSLLLWPDAERNCFLGRCQGLKEVTVDKVCQEENKCKCADAVEQVDSDVDEAILEKLAGEDSDGTLVSEGEDVDKYSDVNDSDVEMIEKEKEQDHVQLEEEQDHVHLPRRPLGTHTVCTNEYYTLTDNPNYPDCRLRFHDSWINQGGLGKRCSSKTLVPAHHNDDRRNPVCTYIVLRAWALFRMSQSPEWLKEKTVRQMFVESEIKALREELQAVKRPLSQKAEARLQEWAPRVLTV